MEVQDGATASEPSTTPVFNDATLYENRLSIPTVARIPIASILGFLGGFGLGISHGGQMAGMRFRAENSHRFPKSQVGWYLYHKTKNYHIALGGIKEGTKMGVKVSLWAGSFFVVEEVVDQLRGTKDFVSTAVAGLGIAGAFSAWSRLPLMTAMRTAKTGLYGGLVFGFIQDALGLARGRQLRYVEFIKDVLGHREALSEAEKS